MIAKRIERGKLSVIKAISRTRSSRGSSSDWVSSCEAASELSAS